MNLGPSPSLYIFPRKTPRIGAKNQRISCCYLHFGLSVRRMVSQDSILNFSDFYLSQLPQTYDGNIMRHSCQYYGST